MRLTLPVSTAVLVTLLSPSASAHVNWFVERGAATLPNYGMTDPVFLFWSRSRFVHGDDLGLAGRKAADAAYRSIEAPARFHRDPARLHGHELSADGL